MKRRPRRAARGPAGWIPFAVRSSCSLSAAVLLGMTASAASGLAQERVDLRPYVTGAIALYNEHTDDPLPRLTSRQIEDLLAGEVVKIRREEAAPAGEDSGHRHHQVTGMILVDQPRVNVWIAVMDGDLWNESRYRGVRIWEDGKGRATMYQHVALPWPVADRHWVIDLAKGAEVARASEGLIWEHSWDLADGGEEVAHDVVAEGRVPGLTLEDVEEAVYLPLNHGGWIVVSLTENRSLLVYHVSVDPGGNIPESWVSTVAMAHLQDLLEQAAEKSALVPGHYRGDHRPILSGWGEPIPLSEPGRDR